MTKGRNDLVEERGQDYGPWQTNMQLLADYWMAMLRMHWQKEVPEEILLNLHLPGWMAAKMMAGTKSLRSCYPGYYLQDNFDDEFNYTNFAQMLQEDDLPPSPRNPK